MAWIEGYELFTDELSGIENARGTSYADKIIGSGAGNTLAGLAGNDTILGWNGNDTLSGGTGTDNLVGGLGNDVIKGEIGNDSLDGGAGSDALNGGLGRDVMRGGAGIDRFIFTATGETGVEATTADRITDFTHGVDRIDLHAIDASTVLSGENAFTFIGAAAFGTTGKGEIRFEHVDAAGTANDFTLVYLDTDADTAAEAVIRLNGLVTLTAADFVL
ncbi:M10 family metallopeptidase C-terminal domain-containing protein [Rhodobacter viridis]|nr:M10 family metallopeptidase C-terminal domain-containing protein [Rhodobacter viridis]